jgi:uncharacterized protein (TIGR02217 family)
MVNLIVSDTLREVLLEDNATLYVSDTVREVLVTDNRTVLNVSNTVREVLVTDNRNGINVSNTVREVLITDNRIGINVSNTLREILMSAGNETLTGRSLPVPIEIVQSFVCTVHTRLPIDLTPQGYFIKSTAVNFEIIKGIIPPAPLPVFPSLPGQAWSVIKTAKWDYRVQRSVSGIDFRVNEQTIPIWQWELNYTLLRDEWDTRSTYSGGLGVGYNEFRELAGFFNQMAGGNGLFLYQDPTDYTITSQQIGVGDGRTQSFQLGRTFGSSLAGGGFFEPITNYQSVINLYIGGVLQNPVTYSVDPNTGIVTLSTIPGQGVNVTVDFTYYFLCRFVDDGMNFENFMYQIWQNKSVKFMKVLL